MRVALIALVLLISASPALAQSEMQSEMDRVETEMRAAAPEGARVERLPGAS